MTEHEDYTLEAFKDAIRDKLRKISPEERRIYVSVSAMVVLLSKEEEFQPPHNFESAAGEP